MYCYTHRGIHLTERCQNPGASPAGSHMCSPNFQRLPYNFSCNLESQTYLLYLLNFALINWRLQIKQLAQKFIIYIFARFSFLINRFPYHQPVMPQKIHYYSFSDWDIFNCATLGESIYTISGVSHLYNYAYFPLWTHKRYLTSPNLLILLYNLLISNYKYCHFNYNSSIHR